MNKLKIPYSAETETKLGWFINNNLKVYGLSKFYFGK